MRSAALASLCLVCAPLASAQQEILFDYTDVRVMFDAGSSGMSVADHVGTSLIGSLFDASDTLIDRANIASSAAFDMVFSPTITNPGGLDDISLAGSVSGTDTDLGPDAYLADVMNMGDGGDADGIIFSGGVLLVRGVVSGPGGMSILRDPLAGDWVFKGTSDSPVGAGSDGTSNQFTIGAADRGAYQSGALVFIDIFVPNFRDGTSTLSITNADDFFAQATAHDGFDSTGGDMKLTIVPEPASAALFGIAGLLGLRRR
jgi:hypothetical protein